MSILQRFSRRLSAAAAAFTILAVASPAQSAVIAVFDPAFGPAYPGLGFKGQAIFDVTAGCYSIGSGTLAVGGSCLITPLSAEIDFYSLLDPLMTPVPSSVILDGTGFPSGYVNSFYLDPLTGQITGFGTNDSNPFTVSVPSLGVTPTTMVLYFQLPAPPPPVISIAAVTEAAVPGVGGAFLRRCDFSTEGPGPCPAGTAADTSTRATLTVSVIPEPDSVALALLGLGALVITRRRKSLAS